MKLNLIILTAALFISCSSNKSKNNNKENLNLKETENISQPIPCDFPEKLSLEKLNNLWKKYSYNSKTVGYYYFDRDGTFSECTFDPISKLIVSNENFKYFFQPPDKIEIHKITTEHIFAHLWNNFSLNMRNSTKNETEVFSKIEPDSKEFQEVKSLCNF